MGCASSAQVRPREWDGSSPGLASRPASALVSTSGRTAGRFGASPRRQTLQATTPPGSPPGFCNAASTRLVFAGAGDSGFQAARSPPMSPGQAVTEGMFSTTKSRKDGEKKTAPAAAGASVRPAAAGATTAATTTQAQTPPPKKKLTASQQQDADRERLRAKLHEVDDLMFKASQKSIALATMEESLIRLSHAVTVERDGRVVAELASDTERTARQRAEEKIQLEIEQRHDLISRLDRANDVARHAENEARDLRLGAKFRDAEIDRSAQEKILEHDLALCKRTLAETVAKHAEERVVKDLETRMIEERPRLDEDSERTRVERRIKEAVQMALAKHEREASMGLMKASEDKVRALEVASVQRRQAMETQQRLHEEELRRVQEASARDLELIREEMRPTRWEIEKLQEDRIRDQLEHAESRKLALVQANQEYEANLEKIKLSHAFELATLRGANEDRLAVYERERVRHETKFSVLTSGLQEELADYKAKFERERELRRVAEDSSKLDLAKKVAAEAEFEDLRLKRREALDLVSEARRARDTAERRTKETYLEIERAKVAGDKRRFLHSDEALSQRPSTAERAVESLPGALGLLFVDDLIADVATARAEVHDLTAPKRLADLELQKYRSAGGTDASYVEAMSANAYQKTAALERACAGLEAALTSLWNRKAGEVREIGDERSALRRGALGESDEWETRRRERNGTKESAPESSGGETDTGSDSDDQDDRKAPSFSRFPHSRADHNGDSSTAKPGDTKADFKSPGKENKKEYAEPVVESKTPPSSPPPREEFEKRPNGNRNGKASGTNTLTLSPAKPNVKEFKFTPLEW